MTSVGKAPREGFVSIYPGMNTKALLAYAVNRRLNAYSGHKRYGIFSRLVGIHWDY